MIPLAADAETRRLLEGINPSGAVGMDTQHRADELLARAAWSRMSEPGDRAAGVLIALIGAPALLAHLVAGSTPAEIAADAWRDPSEARGSALDPRAVRAAVERWRPRLSHTATLQDLELAAGAGLKLLIPGDPHWPERLNDLGDHAPLALWVRGDPGTLRAHGLAVVGARASSGYGENVTAEIVGGVCDAGAAIISGAAYGIDAVAHRAALAVGATTIAVLAGGADRAYPAAHATLIDRIAEQGAVCSEIIPGGAPTRWRFLQRNRVIAALAAATLVTEAGTRSGSLNTAGHAAELGRPLGAVPGPVSSGTSAGCHRLIREYGAVLVTNAADACELVQLDTVGLLDEATGPDRPPPLHRRLVDALPLRGARELSDAARRAGMSLDEARATVVELELLGAVERRAIDRGERAGEEGWALVAGVR